MKKKKLNINEYYYSRREEILQSLSLKYWNDKKFRNKAKSNARNRYHIDPVYREKTLKRATERYYRLRSPFIGNRNDIKLK